VKIKYCSVSQCRRLTLADQCDLHRAPPIQKELQQWVESKRIRDEIKREAKREQR
jgi:hypothetical protein